MNIFEHINSWKYAKNLWHIQNGLNLKELESYPNHWSKFILHIKKIIELDNRVFTIKDVGCGSGIYYKICKDNFDQQIIYKGYDYSENAVDFAEKKWGKDIFECKDYKDFTKEDFLETDIFHACSLHNVLPNGDECLEHCLKISNKYVILGKILTTDEQSKYSMYKAYDDIWTYRYCHNLENLLKIFNKYNYNVFGYDSNCKNCQNLLLVKN